MEQPASRRDEDALPGYAVMELEDVAVGDLDLMEELFMAAPGFDFSDLSQPGAGAPPGACFSPLFDICSTTTTATPPAPAGEDDRDDPERADWPEADVAAPPRPAWLFQPGQEVEATVRERLRRALERIASLSQTQPGELLAQVWVPTLIGDRQVLTTCGQPFWLDSRNQRLANYRSVSMKYQFSADESARAELGLPGRVFVGRVPEWTPDVRYFSTEEYPRVRHAQSLDIRGSVALPIFEPRTRACLGVIELVMTTQKINYNAEVENICSALKVDCPLLTLFFICFHPPTHPQLLCRLCCYALNLFDEMPLGKDVLLPGTPIPEVIRLFTFLCLVMFLSQKVLCLCKLAGG